MRTLIVLCFLCSNLKTFSQGIVFETDWKTAREKARVEKKLLFIDYYNDWYKYFQIGQKEAYQDSAIVAYFQANFVAIRFDEEKEEGMKLNKAYNLEGNSTLLFINADNLDVISRTSGYDYRFELFDFAKSAYQRKDITPLSILQKKYDAGVRDKAFLANLMQRKTLCGINVKEEMKAYLQQFELDDLIATSSDLGKYRVWDVDFNTSEYNFFKNIKRKKSAADNFIGTLLYGSTDDAFELADKKRDIALLGRVLSEIAVVQTPQKAEYYKVKYAQSDSNTTALFNATNRYINNYLMTDSIEKVNRIDSLYYVEVLKSHKNSEDSLKLSLQNQGGEPFVEIYKHQKAMLLSGSIADIVEPLLLRLKDKKQLETVKTWTKYAYDLYADHSQVKYVYAVNLYKLGDKSKALSLMEKAMEYLKNAENKMSYQEKQRNKFNLCYEKMQKGNF